MDHGLGYIVRDIELDGHLLKVAIIELNMDG